MSKALKCDRCGKFYEKNEEHKLTYNGCKTVPDGVATTTANGFCNKNYDLCDQCLNDFLYFMNGGKVKYD